jgi:hypothetical protein
LEQILQSLTYGYASFVEKFSAYKVSPIKALDLLERAASDAGVNLRDADSYIWEKSARRT